MILNPKQQLTELVRLLHSRGHVFAADPEPITELLRHDSLPVTARLVKRAELIDSNHALRQRLQRTQNQLRLLLLAASMLLFVTGFTTTLALMASANINFFYLLLSILGLNSIMLLLWLLFAFIPGRLPGGIIAHPTLWLRGRDAVTQALVHLYANSTQGAAMRWYAGKTSHRLWLCTLSGIWLALWLMLLVRQYSFNWESTLLSTQTLVTLVSALSWLPEQLGLPVPDAQAVVRSRSVLDSATASLWGSLLVGSVFCYGLLPRALAWLWCWLMWRRHHGRLPLAQPYYQHIIQRWRQTVVDADNASETSAVITPPVRLNNAPKWAAMLDAPWPDAHWYRAILGQEWLNQGVLDSRSALSTLTNALNHHPAQLLLGVRAHSAPDRGLLRQLDALAQTAQGGVLVQLLADDAQSAADSLPETLKQWHQALSSRQIPWLDPAAYAQGQRLPEPTRMDTHT